MAALVLMMFMMMMMIFAAGGYFLYLQGKEEEDDMDVLVTAATDDADADQEQELDPDLFGTVARTDAERSARYAELTQDAVATDTATDGTETYVYVNEREQRNTNPDGRPALVTGILKLMKPGTIKSVALSGFMKSGPDSTCSAHRIQVHKADGTKVYDTVINNGGSVEWKEFASTFPGSSAWTNLPAGSTVTMLLKNVEPQCNSVAKAGMKMAVKFMPNEEFISIGQIRRDRRLQRLRRRALPGM